MVGYLEPVRKVDKESSYLPTTKSKLRVHFRSFTHEMKKSFDGKFADGILKDGVLSIIFGASKGLTFGNCYLV